MSMFNTAVSMYARKFGDTPTVMGLGEEGEAKATDVLLMAVKHNIPFATDEEFYEAIGMIPPDDNEVV